MLDTLIFKIRLFNDFLNNLKVKYFIFSLLIFNIYFGCFFFLLQKNNIFLWAYTLFGMWFIGIAFIVFYFLMPYVLRFYKKDFYMDKYKKISFLKMLDFNINLSDLRTSFMLYKKRISVYDFIFHVFYSACVFFICSLAIYLLLTLLYAFVHSARFSSLPY